MRNSVLLLVFILCLPLAGSAHVNSPDVYYDGYAGPYHLLVTVRPAPVVPGVAEIQIRVEGAGAEQIKIVPLRMLGVASTLAPSPDVAERSSADPQLFLGKLWIMSRGSWKVRINVEGQKGPGELFVPLPAVSSNTARMQFALGGLLAFLGLALVVGLVGIVGAANRDAELEPGVTPDAARKKRGAIRMAIAAVLLVFTVAFGGAWWKADATSANSYNYKVPQLHASLESGNLLHLQLENPNTREPRFFNIPGPDPLVLDDLVPDHGHIMHLFLVRTPDMNSFWHLHPDPIGTGDFAVNLPAIPPGTYRIYADIVHHTGFPETQVGEINVPALSGEKLSGDDSGVDNLSAAGTIAQLSDGYRMVWERDRSALKANQPIWFRFRVEDKDGKPASDLEPYMGMAGHAVFMSVDGTIFAHVHPAGSVSMAAVNLAQAGNMDSAMGGMPGMSDQVGPEVSFPYGFPKPGKYRVFVQVKRAGHVETGSFSATVE